MKKLLAILVALMLAATACGGDDTSDGATAVDSTPDQGDDGADDQGDDGADDRGFSGSGSGDFCEMARQLEDTDPAEGLGLFDEEYFERMAEIMGEVRAAAPAEIAGDVDTLIGFFADMESVLADNDYNVMSPAVIEAMSEMDTTGLDEAGERIEAYLFEVCGIDASAGLDIDADSDMTDGTSGDGEDGATGSDSDVGTDMGTDILGSLGIDAELAACLERELGPAFEEFDPENPDMSILTKQVCGTSMMEILTRSGG